jgi:hypothetical protein
VNRVQATTARILKLAKKEPANPSISQKKALLPVAGHRAVSFSCSLIARGSATLARK